jgi:hypothetical protein
MLLRPLMANHQRFKSISSGIGKQKVDFQVRGLYKLLLTPPPLVTTTTPLLTKPSSFSNRNERAQKAHPQHHRPHPRSWARRRPQSLYIHSTYEPSLQQYLVLVRLRGAERERIIQTHRGSDDRHSDPKSY